MTRTEPQNRKKLSAHAKQALEEAEARRALNAQFDGQQPKELKGRKGPEPTRYGDWETKGIVSDF